MKFTEFNLHPTVMAGIEAAGFTDCTPVQEKCLVHTLMGRDVTVQSQTGTGKTAAFLISIFQRFTEGALEGNRKALVIAPTRELAEQIEKDGLVLGQGLDLTMGTFYGGVGYKPQEDRLNAGCKLMIGTPGRLLDLARNRKFSFRDVSILVIDEADRLFDMGFLPDLRRMLRQMPRWDQRQTMLFSATLSMRVKALAWDHMNNPVEIRIEPEKVTVDEVEQVVYHVGRHEKMRLLLGLLKRYQPKNAVIFTNTKHAAVEVSKRLTLNGYNSGYLTGDMTQAKRLKTVERAKAGELPFLVATDVASRGLHIENLELVVNYDLPEDPESYVHRIGRTARVGNQGRAVSLACEKFVFALEGIEKYIRMEIPVEWADDDLFIDDASAGVPISTRVKSDQPRGGRRDRDRGRSRKPAGRSPGGKRPPRPKREGGRHVASRSGKPAERSATTDGIKPDRNGTPEQRAAYYRMKYGENFKPPVD